MSETYKIIEDSKLEITKEIKETISKSELEARKSNYLYEIGVIQEQIGKVDLKLAEFDKV